MTAPNLRAFPVWPRYFAPQPQPFRVAMAGMERSERAPAAWLQSGQQAQLSVLLQWAAARVPYYRDAGWPAAAVERVRRDPASFWDTWRELPVLTKATLRAVGPRMNAPDLPPSQLPLAQLRTSGSTGIPVELGSTALTRFVWYSMLLRENRWRQRDFGKRLGFIRYYGKDLRSLEGHDRAAWPAPISKLHSSGPMSMMYVGHSVDVLATWLRRFDPHYLITHPSVTGPVMDELSRAGVKPASLEEVGFVAEALAPALEARVRSEWNVRCTENYSSNETGYVAFRCERDSLHVQSESLLFEVLDDRGRPCEVGQAGRVVVTPLHNLATPLIRYEIGDYATLGEPCSCGRTLPVIRQVLGRVRNLVRTPDGRRYWPVELAKFKSMTAIQQFQFVQTALDAIELRLVLNDPLTVEEHGQLVEFARAALGHPFEVQVTPVAAIERGPTGKFEEFLSLLPDA
jgi:phenylacetate-CoA ligase